MRRGSNLLKIILDVAIFIILEFATFSLLNNNKSIQSFFLCQKAHQIMADFWGLSQNISYYFSLKEINDSLAKENFILFQKLANSPKDSLIDSYKSDTYLQILKDKNREFSLQYAEVEKISLNKQHNYLIIGAGAKDGVEISSAVISKNAVIGIIEAVSEHYSYASSFMNNHISVSSRLKRSGAIGSLYWDGKSSNMAVLKDIPLQYDIAPGDTVFTSGFSSIFPKDIPLGRCISYKVVNGSSYNIDIQLFVDFSSIRYVYIAKNNRQEEIANLEKIYE